MIPKRRKLQYLNCYMILQNDRDLHNILGNEKRLGLRHAVQETAKSRDALDVKQDS